MLSWMRNPPLWAIIVFLSNASATLSIPSPPNKYLPPELINATNSSLEAPAGRFRNLTYTPWPPRPYVIRLHPRSGVPELIIISVSEFRSWPSVSVAGLQDFVHEFRDNIEREYPVPRFVPRAARQSIVDVQSYTEWLIEINEGVWGYRLPTDYAWAALNEIARLLGSHGPATIYFTISEWHHVHSYGILDISELRSISLNRSMVNTNRGLQKT